MRRTMCLVAGLCFASVCAIADEVVTKTTGSSEGFEILKKAETALKEVKQVSYRAEFKATGWVAAFVPEVSGTALLGERSKWDLDRFRCEVKLQPRGSSEVIELTAGSDGDLFFLIDSKNKMAYEDMDPAVLGSQGRDIQRVLMREFTASDPFGDEIKPDLVELKGTESVGGEECYQIHIKSDTPPEVVWFISKKDFLPRRVRRIHPNRRDPKGEPGTTELTVTNLVVNPKLNSNPFKLVVPTGFTKTNDFAP